MRLGTRGSALALAQSGAIAARLPGAELVVIASDGDRSAESLASLGGTGVFASALREALIAGEVDAVVHSLKDLPTAAYPGLAIAAVPKRADARDTLVSRHPGGIDGLPDGARIGTGSPRRRAQLLEARPDLTVVDIRGNVDSRLARVLSEDAASERALDAVVLAAAGLSRLGRLAEASELLDIDDWPTAPGQGALAVETRAGEERLASKLEHRPSRLTAGAERAVLAELEAGCAAPVAARALLEEGLLFLSARVYQPDGTAYLTSSHALYPDDSLDPVGELAQRVSAELLSAGAAELAPVGGGG